MPNIFNTLVNYLRSVIHGKKVQANQIVIILKSKPQIFKDRKPCPWRFLKRQLLCEVALHAESAACLKQFHISVMNVDSERPPKFAFTGQRWLAPEDSWGCRVTHKKVIESLREETRIDSEHSTE